jgi:type IV fimbrial biogenesis protein FimT
MKTSNGFTLVELMLAVIIIAFLATIAVPAFKDLTLRNKLTASANEVLKSVLLARAEAVKRNTTVSTCAPGADTTVWATACDGTDTTWTSWATIARNGNNGAGSSVLASHSLDDLGGQVKIQNASSITFGGDGIAMTGAGPVVGTIADIYSNELDSDNHRCVSITGGSAVRIVSQDGACP